VILMSCIRQFLIPALYQVYLLGSRSLRAWDGMRKKGESRLDSVIRDE
jgi:hypothetical protein